MLRSHAEIETHTCEIFMACPEMQEEAIHVFSTLSCKCTFAKNVSKSIYVHTHVIHVHVCLYM